MIPSRHAPASRPSLLISVRTIDEVRAALPGADIIDIKEPSRGALGMADLATIGEIARILSLSDPEIGLSVALGELQEWPADRERSALPDGITWAKLGLRGEQQRPDWRERWLCLRQELDQQSGRALNWIAVAYADAEKVQSPAVHEVLQAAVETGCAGLLIDTVTKSGGSLLEYLSPLELLDIMRRARECHLPVAIAGKVSARDLPLLCALEPDIIGVRSAVCRQGDRAQAVSSAGVAGFLKQLAAACRPDDNLSGHHEFSGLPQNSCSQYYRS